MGNCSIVNVNRRNLTKYWGKFKTIVENVEGLVDIYILTEVRVADDQLGLLQLNGYHNFFSTRQTSRGGGNGIYMRNVWAASTIYITFLYAETLALNV